MKEQHESIGFWEKIMDFLEKTSPILSLIPTILFIGLVLYLLVLYVKDKNQTQHSILKTHPVIGRFRYIFEKIGPEMRQYWFSGDKEGRPVDRDTMETIAKAGKYASTVMGFGSKKDYSKPDFYLANDMFPKNVDELKVDNQKKIKTYIYQILNEGLISRSEKRIRTDLNPWHLTDEHAIVIGEKRKYPFKVKGLIGISAMSYGSLSASAVKALAQGVAISQGSWMNTGEGGISPYHLSKIYDLTEKGVSVTKITNSKLVKSFKKWMKKIGIHSINVENEILELIYNEPNTSCFRLKEDFGDNVTETIKVMIDKGLLIEKYANLIFQVGSGLFGARKDGKYHEETFLCNALRPEVKAIEIKLAQGAKVRGGKLPKEKITPEIAAIRGVEMGKDVESPNRFPLFSNMDELFDLITNWQEITGKPVGIKVVAGSELSFEELALYMKNSGKHPDFITIDGGEGGTGATYQEMADSLGLPIYSGLQILDKTLRKYGVRDQVKIFASGMLATADKMAIALSLGADFVNVARAAMNSIGCINSGICSSGRCPSGVATHDQNLIKGVVVQEKRFRTANYLTTMRQGMFMLGSSCGLESPTLFERKHVTYRDKNSDTKRMDQVD